MWLMSDDRSRTIQLSVMLGLWFLYGSAQQQYMYIGSVTNKHNQGANINKTFLSTLHTRRYIKYFKCCPNIQRLHNIIIHWQQYDNVHYTRKQAKAKKCRKKKPLLPLGSCFWGVVVTICLGCHLHNMHNEQLNSIQSCCIAGSE